MSKDKIYTSDAEAREIIGAVKAVMSRATPRVGRGETGAHARDGDEMVKIPHGHMTIEFSAKDPAHGNMAMTTVLEGDSADDVAARLKSQLDGAAKSTRKNRRAERSTLRS